MADLVLRTGAARLWLMRLSFALIGLAIILIDLMPLETAPRRWAGPDLLLALIFAWTIRRPAYAPLLIVALLMLLSDLMLQRPPGLMAALVVLGCEWLKGRGRAMRELPFAAEWLAASVAMAGVVIGYRVLLVVFVTDLPPLFLNLMQLVVSAAIYPLVVLASVLLFGLRKQSPGEAAALGSRI
ncbi:rod shape-determining protein MreD [Pseudooceanicola sp.]|uniref:rod shape-determining protein MreD n=1 Tax=Pseudooceanicola sp. TaxID=1914328 RepID=UPI00261F9222|nr:rod shape-determining protein MreD [Pseudooceanicola sp.]MDF1856093.1 rod shape-determining protein MreD [Pseudooceanicola sp.]